MGPPLALSQSKAQQSKRSSYSKISNISDRSGTMAIKESIDADDFLKIVTSNK